MLFNCFVEWDANRITISGFLGKEFNSFDLIKVKSFRFTERNSAKVFSHVYQKHRFKDLKYHLLNAFSK